MEFSRVSPLAISENILSMLGNKVAAGQELTMAQRLMALSAAGEIISSAYGPGPTEMTVKAPQLPENVKGMLANYAG